MWWVVRAVRMRTFIVPAKGRVNISVLATSRLHLQRSLEVPHLDRGWDDDVWFLPVAVQTLVSRAECAAVATGMVFALVLLSFTVGDIDTLY